MGEIMRPKLSECDAAIEWLRQFEIDDQAAASSMLDAIMLVSHNEFFERLSKLVLERGDLIEGRVGLYAEREIRKHKGMPNRLFKESRGSHHRAFGHGPPPVKPTRTLQPEIGSEALIAHLITELCRADPRKFANHPGPDQIREDGIGAFFLVTDFIGSGTRVNTYLEAAWRIASVKSWRSLGLMKFEVLAHAGTDIGVSSVAAHRSRPTVSLVTPCPTIVTEFDNQKASRIRSICIRYDPIKCDSIDSLGYGGVGALMAFAHGCPNNAPRILYKTHLKQPTQGRPRWKPLFPARVTAGSRSLFGDRRDASTLANRLARLGEQRLAKGAWIRRTHLEGRQIIAVLAAVRRGPRRDEIIALRTGFTIPEVVMLIRRVATLGWIGADRRLTDEGHGQLAHARASSEPKVKLPSPPKEEYYPKSLRAPRAL